METIKNYLETMFRNLPQTEKVLRAKSELFQMMEDKYTELIKDGKTENEAVGTVISEFGNLEELAKDLGIEDVYFSNKAKNKRLLSFDEVKSYLKVRKQAAYLVGIGVFLCITSVVFPIFGNALNSDSGIWAVAMFIMIGAGIALFVLNGTISENWKFVRYGECVLDSSEIEFLRQERTKNISSYSIMKSLGILCCALCFVPAILFDDYIDFWNGKHLDMDELGGAMLFILVGLGVFLLIFSSKVKRSIETLLNLNSPVDNLKDSHKNENIKYKNPTVATLMSVYWETVTAIYLCWSFLTFSWHFTWIIWPIASILYSIIKNIFKQDIEA